MTFHWYIFLIIVCCSLFFGSTLNNGQSSSLSNRPNILFILVDDLGFGDVNFNREIYDSEISTPNLDKLVKNEGLLLHRHYVHYTCTPTRTSFQSGRLPVHVTQSLRNPDEPNAGIPRNMTGIASKMQMAGYQTHIVGKWDCGMATFDHTPHGRGYNSSLIYFEHKNDYWTMVQMQSGCLTVYPEIVDLWSNNRPAYNLNGTLYEEYLFAQRIYSLIDNFSFTSADNPFFLVYTPHLIHCPLQLPKEKLSFNFTNDENECSQQTSYIYPGSNINASEYKCRSMYHSMVSILDDIIGDIEHRLKMNNLWNNTLIVFSSDNGGPITLPESGANNHPLRGSKYSPFEGGIRSVAFVSGGYLPKSRHGMNESGMIHICDWYSTFCAMLNISAFDVKGDKYNLPPVEGYNVWPLISGLNLTSPRTQVPVDNHTLLNTRYKYMEGNISFASWEGSTFPNASSEEQNVQNTILDCVNGCLFDILDDFTEHINIANENIDIVRNMNNTLNELRNNYWSNEERGVDSCPSNISVECACWMAKYYWNGFFGPYQYMNISEPQVMQEHVKLEVAGEIKI